MASFFSKWLQHIHISICYKRENVSIVILQMGTRTKSKTSLDDEKHTKEHIVTCTLCSSWIWFIKKTPTLSHYQNRCNSRHLRLRKWAVFSLNTGTHEVKALHYIYCICMTFLKTIFYIENTQNIKRVFFPWPTWTWALQWQTSNMPSINFLHVTT